MDKSELRNRSMKACVLFLERRGYDVIDILDDNNINIVAIDNEENSIVFIKVFTRDSTAKGFMSDNMTDEFRNELEESSIKYLRENNDIEVNRPVRFDTISLIVLGDSKAMIRHHINAIN